jgi:hypothetical protein
MTKVSRRSFVNTVGATATWETTGGDVTLIHKLGPDCGLAQVLIDGQPAAQAEFDTCAPTVEWNHRRVLATNPFIPELACLSDFRCFQVDLGILRLGALAQVINTARADVQVFFPRHFREFAAHEKMVRGNLGGTR